MGMSGEGLTLDTDVIDDDDIMDYDGDDMLNIADDVLNYPDDDVMALDDEEMDEDYKKWLEEE